MVPGTTVRRLFFVQNAVKYLRQRSENAIIIGQVREVYNDDKYPSIKDLINKPINKKGKIIEYMKRSKIEAVAPGIATDLINPENKLAELLMMSDGKYAWRSDVIYYFEKYNMELPNEFIQHVLNQLSCE